jgi:hypothetical protein
MATSTAAVIRDRVRTLIAQVDPVSFTGTRFRDWRYEGTADFRDAMEKLSAGAFRRYYVRNVGNDEPPAVSNMSFEERRLTLEILIAYPATHCYGADNAMDRDDIIEEDWVEIDFQIGLCSRANFGDSSDCTPLGCTKEIERGGACDILVIRAEYLYQRVLSAAGGLIGLPNGLGG